MGAKRKAIRAAVVSMLSGNTSAGTNVFGNRAAKYFRAELPAINVTSASETATPRDVAGRQSHRTLELEIEIRAEGDESIDDTLDDIAEEVEAIIKADQSLSGTAHAAVYIKTEINEDPDSEKMIGKAVLTYEVKFIE